MQSEAKTQDIPFNEAITAGGCTRNSHIELTLGKGRFEGVECPKCHLTVYRP